MKTHAFCRKFEKLWIGFFSSRTCILEIILQRESKHEVNLPFQKIHSKLNGFDFKDFWLPQWSPHKNFQSLCWMKLPLCQDISTKNHSIATTKMWAFKWRRWKSLKALSCRDYVPTNALNLFFSVCPQKAVLSVHLWARNISCERIFEHFVGQWRQLWSWWLSQKNFHLSIFDGFAILMVFYCPTTHDCWKKTTSWRSIYGFVLEIDVWQQLPRPLLSFSNDYIIKRAVKRARVYVIKNWVCDRIPRRNQSERRFC